LLLAPLLYRWNRTITSSLVTSLHVRPLVMSFRAQATLECTYFSVTLNHALTDVADGYSSTSCLDCSADTNTLGWGSDLLRCALLNFVPFERVAYHVYRLERCTLLAYI